MRYLVNINDHCLDDYSYIYEKAETLRYFAQMNYEHHIPVLLKETLELLAPVDGGVYVDCTFGAGGHTAAILNSADCKVIAIDRDPQVKLLADDFKEKFGDRFIFSTARFSDIDEVLDTHGVDKVDGILMDLGFSSMQVDTPRRGFSFQFDGPLDMRMSCEGVSAEDFINGASEEDISDVLYRFGDERKSRIIARAICAARKKERITHTLQLAEIIASSVRGYNDDINPATRTFQAIRIFINEEFNELKSVLQKAKDRLKENSRMVVITFHSGEDLIVKDFFKTYSSSGNAGFSRYSPGSILATNSLPNELEIITHKPIAASQEEIEMNIRARSAKVRAAKKLGEMKKTGTMN